MASGGNPARSRANISRRRLNPAYQVSSYLAVDTKLVHAKGDIPRCTASGQNQTLALALALRGRFIPIPYKIYCQSRRGSVYSPPSSLA